MTAHQVNCRPGTSTPEERQVLPLDPAKAVYGFLPYNAMGRHFG